MKKLLVLSAFLAMFSFSQISYGMAKILVYKGTIKASKTIFDVNDDSKLVSKTIQGYWVVSVYREDSFPFVQRGLVYNSNCVIYSTKEKHFKVIPNSISIDPCDPCGIVIMNFNPSDADGEMWFDAIGKGKLKIFPHDPNETRDYVATTLKGTGFVDRYDFFDPRFTYSGPVTVTLTLDTRLSVPNVDYGFMVTGYTTVDDVTNDIVNRLTSSNGWTEWPDLTPP